MSATSSRSSAWERERTFGPHSTKSRRRSGGSSLLAVPGTLLRSAKELGEGKATDGGLGRETDDHAEGHWFQPKRGGPTGRTSAPVARPDAGRRCALLRLGLGPRAARREAAALQARAGGWWLAEGDPRDGAEHRGGHRWVRPPRAGSGRASAGARH